MSIQTDRKMEYRDCGRITLLTMKKEQGQPNDGRYRVKLVRRIIGAIHAPEDIIDDQILLHDAAVAQFDLHAHHTIDDHYTWDQPVRHLADLGVDGLRKQIAIDETTRTQPKVYR